MKTRTSAILAGVLVAGGLALAPSGSATAEPCNGTYTHCETNRCVAATFYRNYDPTSDHFSSEYGDQLVQGEQGNIRDEPYRRYGPRGVRAMHGGQWGFYSVSCFP